MQSEMRKRRDSQKKSKKARMTACIVITLVFFAVFAARLFDWQVVNGSQYKELATRSTSYTVQTDATRGEILDCNGIGLVVNTTHYKVVFDKLYINAKTLDGTIIDMISLMDKTGEKWEDVLPIQVNADNSYSFKKDSGQSVKTMLSQDYLNLSQGTTAEECIQHFKSRYDIKYNGTNTQLRNIISVRYNMELTAYSSTKPYVFASDIKQSTVSAVSEHTQGKSGIEVQTYSTRQALNASLAPHILGALGSITEDEYNKKKQEGKDYSLNDSIGKFGVELACEDRLKGSGGTKIVKKNSDGTIVDTVETIDAKPGDTVYLTLDSRLQQTAAKSLAQNVKAAKAAGVAAQAAYGGKKNGEDCETGAVVMLSVKDFSVLAAASYPTYDLNKYSKYDDYYVNLEQNKNSPMYNRAFVGSFACGSVFKPCVACAALEEKVINKNTEIYCKQNYDYYPTNVVKCMHYHGDLNITGAITKSCNYFFAETGRRLGIENMYLYAERFGFGEYTGVEVEESKGTLAGRDSTSWQAGNTVQAAIGQSDNAFTPLQLATYVATIANNGTRLKTHVIKKITDYSHKNTILENKSDNPVKLDTCGVSQKNIDIVKNAMLDVTQNPEGTAYSMFGDYKVKVAAKTGTAENSGSDHTTFVCYAPYDNPEVAISVVIEHGAKGMYSMQVAKDLLNSYFSEKKSG